MGLSPASILYDSGGTEKATAGNPVRTDPTGTTAQPVTDNGGSLTVDGTVAVSNLPAVQPVSDNAGSLTVDDGGVSLTVDGPLTDAELRATAVPVADGGGSLTVDGTVTANAGTGPWPVTDNAGSLTVDTPQLPGALVGGRLDQNVGAWLGSTAPTVGQKTLANSIPVAMASDQSAIPVTTTGGEEATYTAIAQAAVVGNNKSMLSIYNPSGSGYVLKLREFYLRNAQSTAVTGVVGAFQLHRFATGTTPTGGTAVTAVAHDSNDALPAGMDVRTGGTISGEIATPLDKMLTSTDEWGTGTADVESQQQSIANYLPARAKRDGLVKPFFARPGEGLHMKFATNSTAGSFDIIFVFTKV